MKSSYHISLCALTFSVSLFCVADRPLKMSDLSAHDLYILGRNKRIEGDYRKALPYFKTALARDPQLRKAHIELATAYLACENYMRGFDLLDSYVSTSLPTDKLWRGENLAGKRILVYLSQWGVGEDIMFARYLRCLREAGAHVGVAVPERLQRLFSFNLHVDSIQIQNLSLTIEADEIYFNGSVLFRNDIPGYDYYTHLMSLPKLCKIRKTHIPCEPYFSVDAELSDKYAHACAHDRNIKVGICWHGADRNDEQLRQRSMQLKNLIPLLSRPHVTIYCLQQGPAAEEINDMPEARDVRRFDNFDQEAGAFMDTAALMKNLDLVITVDTSIAHLAGACGVKTWVMLPHAAEWRYAPHNEHCDWYPTMRLFKQHTPGDWDSVVSSIMEELNKIK